MAENSETTSTWTTDRAHAPVGGYVLPVLAILAVLPIGVALTKVGWGIAALAAVALALAIVLLMRQDELMALLLVCLSLFEDWYQLVSLPFYLPVISTLAGLLLIGTIFVLQSPDVPWIRIPNLWLWVALLVVALVPMVRASSLLGGIRYYVTVLLTPCIMYVVGVQVTRDLQRARRVLSMLALFGAFIAVHSIIQARTGVFLLGNPTWNAYLASVSDFTLGTGSLTTRAGSFLVNPDSDGTYLAILLFIPLGFALYAASSWRSRLLYALLTALIAVGLFFTYSTAAWIAVGAGMALFTFLALRGRARLYFVAIMAVTVAIAGVLFSRHFTQFLQHASALREYQLRLGIWETALRVIRAYPLSGVGLGLSTPTYEQIAERYRVALQTTPVRHPHNGYLELAALGGLPVLAIFVALLGSSFRLALRAYRAVDRRDRALVAGALASVVVLAVNSLANQGWTLAPIGAVIWLVIGVLASPALTQTNADPPERQALLWSQAPATPPTGAQPTGGAAP